MPNRKMKNATSRGGVSNVSGGQAKTTFQNDQQANHTPISSSAANAKSDAGDIKAKESRSTATDAQILKLRAFLREGPKTTHFLRTHGIHHPAGRVQNLRDKGYEILTSRVDSVDAHGFSHVGVAQYVLMKEPPQQLSLDVQGGK